MAEADTDMNASIAFNRAAPRRFEVTKGQDGKPVALDLNAPRVEASDVGELGDVLEEFIVNGPEAVDADDADVTEKSETEKVNPFAEDLQGSDIDDDVEDEQSEAEQADSSTSEEADEQLTIAQFAEQQGVEAETLYGLLVPDGETTQTVGALKDEVRGLRKQVADGAGQSSADIAKQRAELDSLTEQRLAAIGEIEAEVLDQSMLLRQADKALVELQKIDAAGLDESQMARYSAAMTRATLQKQKAEQELQQHYMQQQQLVGQRMHETMVATAREMPGWMNDQGQFNTVKISEDHAAWLAELGPEYGLKIEDIQVVVDVRYNRMLRDLAEFRRKARETVPEKLKKIEKPAIARKSQKVAAQRSAESIKAQRKAKADAVKRARSLPEHSSERWDSILQSWDLGGA